MHTHRCSLPGQAGPPSLPRHGQWRTSTRGPKLPAKKSSHLDPGQPGMSRGWDESPGQVSEQGGQEPEPDARMGRGAEGAGMGRRWHPGLRAASRRWEAWGQRGGHQAGEDRRETRVACWGLPMCDADKAHGWETSSPKVIFTRKLCCVDLLLCAEEFNYHVLRGVIISAAGSARNTPDPATVPLAQTTPSPGDQESPSPSGLSPPACPGLPQDLSDAAQRGALNPTSLPREA